MSNEVELNQRIQRLETALAFERAQASSLRKSRDDANARIVRLTGDLAGFGKLLGRLYWRSK